MATRIREYAADELAKKKTIEDGPDGQLKIRTARYRVWLKDQAVTYQALYQNRWTRCNPDGSFG